LWVADFKGAEAGDTEVSSDCVPPPKPNNQPMKLKRNFIRAQRQLSAQFNKVIGGLLNGSSSVAVNTFCNELITASATKSKQANDYGVAPQRC